MILITFFATFWFDSKKMNINSFNFGLKLGEFVQFSFLFSPVVCVSPIFHNISHFPKKGNLSVTNTKIGITELSLPFTDGFFFGLVPELEGSLRTSNAHHLLRLVAICYLLQPRRLIIGNFKPGAYFEIFNSLWVEGSLRALKIHHWLPLITNGCPSNNLVSG